MRTAEIATSSLVSWDKIESRGVMPGVGCDTLLGWTLGNRNIFLPPDSSLPGRPGLTVQLQRYTFPEGFDTFTMIDGKTKQPYVQKGMHLGGRHSPIQLENGCIVEDVALYDDGIQSTIVARGVGRMVINPNAQRLYIAAEAPLDGKEAQYARVAMCSEDEGASATVTLQNGHDHAYIPASDKDEDPTGSVSFHFGGSGTIESVTVNRAGFPGIEHDSHGDGPVTDDEECQRLWEAAAKLFDVPDAPLDLRLSAGALYNRMAQPGFNPLHALKAR